MTRIALLLVAVALAAAACSGDDEGATGSTGASAGATLKVLADSSLEDVLPAIAPDVDYEFADTNELAARIEEGEAADVLAAAGSAVPAALAGKALVEPPKPFATNRLVLVVPTGNPKGIESLGDLEEAVLAVGVEGGALRDATEQALEAVGASQLLAAVGSEGADGKTVLDSVASGAADAGFVLATDAQAADADVDVVELPAQALLEYSLAFLTTSERSADADAFIEQVLGDESREKLEAAGFGLPGG
jgi:molybdate transport system substrate-binding protein